MKSLLASIAAVAVLSSGVIPMAAIQGDSLPPWLCNLFPMFCRR